MRRYPRLLVAIIGGLVALSNCATDPGTASADVEPVNDSYDVNLIAALDEAVSADVYKQINGIVVLKNGELLFERYYNGTKPDSLHNPRSVGKTFASILLGLAIRDRYIENLDQTLADFYDLGWRANPNDRKAAVTLRDLVTMSSGFDAYDFNPDSIGNEENMYPTSNWVDWALDLPMAADRDPGDAWFYFTGGAVVLGDILNRQVPGGLEVYAERELFEPLGIEDYQWQYTPQHVVNTAGGLMLTARDFATVGQLYQNNGLWHGRRILPADWIEASFSPHYSTTVPGNDYGYLWWLKTYTANGQSLPVAYAGGNGGNKIFVLLDQPIVVSVTASAYGRPYMHSQVDEIMQRYVLPAILGLAGR